MPIKPGENLLCQVLENAGRSKEDESRLKKQWKISLTHTHSHTERDKESPKGIKRFLFAKLNSRGWKMPSRDGKLLHNLSSREMPLISFRMLARFELKNEPRNSFTFFLLGPILRFAGLLLLLGVEIEEEKFLV